MYPRALLSRVAKGSVNLSTPTTASPYGLNCNLAINPATGLPTNGFTLTQSYIRGLYSWRKAYG
jgi:hypothetical protein